MTQATVILIYAQCCNRSPAHYLFISFLLLRILFWLWIPSFSHPYFYLGSVIENQQRGHVKKKKKTVQRLKKWMNVKRKEEGISSPDSIAKSLHLCCQPSQLHASLTTFYTLKKKHFSFIMHTFWSWLAPAHYPVIASRLRLALNEFYIKAFKTKSNKWCSPSRKRHYISDMIC